MTFDIPHMVVTGILIFVVLWGLNQIGSFEKMSRGRKTFIRFGALFVVLLLLNLVWPYGAGV
ncbi:hypothetical protein [Tropicimonas sediminicola]|uniref:Uncharacterized protein n=1 Tax=Tropicimonas sediminicola TaxID=1031541 RepID=A0A239MF09_9RHOB|nr:hypothetical protein [Tropicimonas sediminicola]SNT41070.1 hypothetical protein SAMN05421757_1182 [Tropicimonas sediminicola]